MMTVQIGDKTSFRRPGATLTPENLIAARERIEVRRASQPVQRGRLHFSDYLEYERSQRRPAP